MKKLTCVLPFILLFATPALSAVVYFSDFELDDGGLARTLDWEWGAFVWDGSRNCEAAYPVSPPTRAYSGSHMWGAVLNDCYNNIGNEDGSSSSGCTNSNPSDDSILTLTVDLTRETDAEMSWWEWYDANSYWDWGEIYANGVVVFQHCESSYTAASTWEKQSVDLTPFVGTTVSVEFHFMASDVVARAGWYIDDLEISNTGPTATPTPTGTPPTPTPSPTPEPVPSASDTGLISLVLAFFLIFQLAVYRGKAR